MKVTVSIIIPNLNGVEFLKICLPSLKRQFFKNLEIIVVDNGSSDGSVSYIKKNFPDVISIKLSQNFGFSKAVNIGIKKSTGKYIVLLNNDTEVDKECIGYLVETAKIHMEIGFVSAKILNFDRREIVDNAGDYMDSVGHLYSRGFGKKDDEKFNKGEYIFLGTGSGTLFKREVFKKVGLFDEDFFFYMEDADFCLRAQLAGFKGWFEPRAKIYHIRMATSRKLKNYESLIFQNMTVTLIKNFPMKLIMSDFNFLKIFLVHLNTIRYLIFKGEILGVVKAESYLIKNFRKILEKRVEIQSRRKISNEYVIENIRKKRIKVGKLFFWKSH